MIAKKQRLDQILFNRNLAESKSKAQAMIMAGQIFVEGKIINKSGFNINSNATDRTSAATYEVTFTATDMSAYEDYAVTLRLDVSGGSADSGKVAGVRVKYYYGA